MLYDLVYYAVAFITLYVNVFYLLLFMQHEETILKKPKPLSRIPSVSVVIPAFNEEKTIGKTIEAALKLDYPRNKLDIVVVNDGSRDNTLAIARKFEKKGVKVIDKPNGGKSSALNLAIKKSKSEFIATLDADSYPQPDCLNKMLGFFSDADVMAVTSVVKAHQPRSLIEKLQHLEYLLTMFGRRLQSYLESVSVTPGPMSVFRKSVFEKVGYFDEQSILEDQEIAFRIQSADFKIRSSMDAVVYTTVPRTFKSLIRQRIRWQRGGVRNIIKHRHLVSTRYGDLGVFIMPFGILSIGLVFMIFFMLIYAIASGSFASGMAGILGGGLSLIYSSLTPLSILSLFVFVSSLLWAFLGIRQLRGKSLISR